MALTKTTPTPKSLWPVGHGFRFRDSMCFCGYAVVSCPAMRRWADEREVLLFGRRKGAVG